MTCKIEWLNDCKRYEWESLLARCPHSTLLQSYYYAQAIRDVNKQATRHGLIKIDKQEAGIVQMHEVSVLKGMVHAFSVDRGPLWFEGFGKPAHINSFVQALNWKYPSRWGRKRRFIPEIFDKKHLILMNNWVKKTNTPAYQTVMLDLTPDENVLRDNLKKNWRQSLTKAEKNMIQVNDDDELKSLSLLLKNYTKDRIAKNYAGASPKFIASLCSFAAKTKDCLILNATEDDEVIASILVFIHGKGATYQLGWTTPYGRTFGANNLLIWEAIKKLKERDVTTFDLGGYNKNIEGIRCYKEGTGGLPIALIGSYS
jgi:hypothetical protein